MFWDYCILWTCCYHGLVNVLKIIGSSWYVLRLCHLWEQCWRALSRRSACRRTEWCWALRQYCHPVALSRQLHFFLNLNVECVSLRILMAEVQYYYFRSSCKALIYHLYLHFADPFLLLPAQWEGVALQHVSWNVVSSVVHEGSLARPCIISCLFQIRRFIIHISEHWQLL